MSTENGPTEEPTPESTEGLIFADAVGKGVFDAFEKLGSELNALTDNLERQFEDAGDSEDILGSFDLKNTIADSHAKKADGSKATKHGGAESTEPALDDIIAMLNEDHDVVGDEEQEEDQFTPTDRHDTSLSPKGHVKRDSVGASSIDADSIASAGSHIPKKISALIDSMRIRSLSVDESSVPGGGSITGGAADEWENDDDCGYTIITLSEEEFFDYEEESSARILAERKEQAKATPMSSPVTKKLSYAAAAAKASTPADAEEPSTVPQEGLPEAEPSVYEPYGSDADEIVVDLTASAAEQVTSPSTELSGSKGAEFYSPRSREENVSKTSTPAVTPGKDKEAVLTSTGERSAEQAVKDVSCSSPTPQLTVVGGPEQLAALLAQGGFGSPALPTPPTAGAAVMPPPVPDADMEQAGSTTSSPAQNPEQNSRPFATNGAAKLVGESRRQSVGEKRRSEIMGQRKFMGVDGMHCYFNLKVIFEPYKTGFEESKDLQHPKGTIIAGRYEVHDVLGQAAFSTALQCLDLAAEEDEAQWVCLKVIKNNKDFLDQSLDEIKLLQYINSCGEPDDHHVLRLIDFFYCKEHLFIVSELLKENLYEFGRFIRESNNEPYYTIPRLKRITKQVLEALVFIHSLKLIHCDIKPENIVIKSFSRCEVKLIDFGSSCFTTDHLTTYIQSRSYRAPEVIIGHPYDTRIDIWSVGAVLAELHTGYVLFQNDSVPTMLSRITGILGQFPQHVLQRGKDTGKYFSLSNIVYERDEEGAFHLIFPKRTDLAARLHVSPIDAATGKLSPDDEQFVDFVRQMLHLDPAQRMTAEQALAHPWLSDADTVYVSEYIIQQGTSGGDGQPPAPGDYDEDASEDVSGEEGEDGSRDEDYDYEDEDLQASEEEEAALQYLLNAHGGTAEAMEAYLQHLQMQQEGAFEDSDGEYADGEEGGEGSENGEEDGGDYGDLQEGDGGAESEQ